jgi:hypothetical protein
MNGLRLGISILVVAAIAITIGAGVTGAVEDPAWEKALMARSEALNEKHGLGDTRTVASTGTPQWHRALRIRSEALNERYGLGRYARNPASATAPQWLVALQIRSDALNRQHKLGEYAPRK